MTMDDWEIESVSDSEGDEPSPGDHPLQTVPAPLPAAVPAPSCPCPAMRVDYGDLFEED